MLLDKNPKLTLFADKILVRDLLSQDWGKVAFDNPICCDR